MDIRAQQRVMIWHILYHNIAIVVTEPIILFRNEYIILENAIKKNYGDGGSTKRNNTSAGIFRRLNVNILYYVPTHLLNPIKTTCVPQILLRFWISPRRTRPAPRPATAVVLHRTMSGSQTWFLFLQPIREDKSRPSSWPLPSAVVSLPARDDVSTIITVDVVVGVRS